MINVSSPVTKATGADTMQNTEKKWTTIDISLGNYLIYRGVQVDLEVIDGRVIFTAQLSDVLYRLLNAYNQNDSIPVLDYTTMLKILRSHMWLSGEARL